MKAFLKKLLKDISGNVLMISGAGSVALVGGAGLGVDTVQWYLWKRQLQQAVDSSALAGAQARVQGSSFTTYATQELNRNANTTVNIESMVNPPATGGFTGNNLAVEVIATTSQALPFSSVFLATAPTIRARAVAARIIDGEFCLRTLATTGVGVQVSGTADIYLRCGVSTNSRGRFAFDFDGSAYLKGSPLSSVGGIDYSSSNVDTGTAMLGYNVAQADPYAGVYSMADVPSGGCDQNNVHITPNSSLSLAPNANGFLRVCNGLFVQGDLTLAPGVYIIDNGDLRVNSTASISGQGVTFILTGPSAATVATVDMQGGANVNLRAPNATDDPSFIATDWYGMLFYQDPKAIADSSGNANRINGDSTSGWDGIVYMPKANLTINGSAGLVSTCLRVVTNRIAMSGEATINNVCPTDVTNHDVGARIVRIVE